MDNEQIKSKYYREIYLTKLRIIEKCIKLSTEQKESLEYRLEPRNKAEDEIKENYMGFVTQRTLEGYPMTQAMKMARVCVDEAIIQAQNEMLKKKRK